MYLHNVRITKLTLELLNELPKYSEWPSRLLGEKPFIKRIKDYESVIREYDVDKWGQMLAIANTDNSFKLGDGDKFELGDDTDQIIWANQRLEKSSSYRSRDQYKTLLKEVLQTHHSGESIVELGAGFGSIILYIAKQEVFKNSQFYAGEFTQSGVDLIKTLSKREGIKITADTCDLAARKITDLNIPCNSIIYTSMAMPYIQNVPHHFCQSLASFNPKLVIHFEPCFDFFDKDTSLGLMQRRYVEMNGYNQDLFQQLQSAQDRKEIDIQFIEKNIFGENPFFPVSIIAWKPGI